MKKGNFYGIAKEWSDKRKRELGTVLLRRACAIFLAEGERQIHPNDIWARFQSSFHILLQFEYFEFDLFHLIKFFSFFFIK